MYMRYRCLAQVACGINSGQCTHSTKGATNAHKPSNVVSFPDSTNEPCVFLSYLFPRRTNSLYKTRVWEKKQRVA